MLPVFANPKTDCVFKRIFGADHRKPLLTALRSHLLEPKGDHGTQACADTAVLYAGSTTSSGR